MRKGYLCSLWSVVGRYSWNDVAKTAERSGQRVSECGPTHRRQAKSEIRRQCRILSLVVLALTITGPLHASPIVFDNNPTDTYNIGGNNPFSYGDVFVAMDFTLGVDTVLDGLVFNAWTVEGQTVPITAVNVQIYNRPAPNTVGASLYSGAFGTSGSNIVVNDGFYQKTDFSVTLPSWSLAAGSYWLGLQVDPAQWNMHWNIVPLLGDGGRIGNGTGDPGSYTAYGWEHDFRLTGAPVPEPASLSLLAVGLAGLRCIRRRRAP